MSADQNQCKDCIDSAVFWNAVENMEVPAELKALFNISGLTHTSEQTADLETNLEQHTEAASSEYTEAEPSGMNLQLLRLAQIDSQSTSENLATVHHLSQSKLPDQMSVPKPVQKQDKSAKHFRIQVEYQRL